MSWEEKATAIAWRGVKAMLLVWAFLVNLVAGRLLPLPIYLTLLGLAGAFAVRKHVHKPIMRGAQRTWLATLLALALGMGVISTVGAAGAGSENQEPTQQPTQQPEGSTNNG